jgi:ribosomal protein L11 methyltransferase
MYWLEVSVRTDGEAAEAVSELLRPYAYNDGVVLEQLGVSDDPTPDALEPIVTVKIYVPENEDTPVLRRRIEEGLYHLNRLYPVPAPQFRQLEEADWAHAWKAHYHPFRLGRRLWIRPSWITDESLAVNSDDVILTLDPGMAFGTGLHPTTQMCLQALEQLTQPGMRVLDVGTGSGILAIAAAKLGATAVRAVDTDQVAVETAMANVRQNEVQNSIVVAEGSLNDVSDKEWDLVVVNILAPVIASMLRHDRLLDYLAPGGRLILSGIIDEQREVVAGAVADAGGTMDQIMSIRDWLALVVTATSSGYFAPEPQN